MKNIRFYITENCNAKCPNCFNGGLRTMTSMDIEKYTALCRFFSEHGTKHIKLMGGEPTIHENFSLFYNTAQNYFGKVSLFTNGTNKVLETITPRPPDSIIYNFTFSKVLTPNRLLLDKDGERALEIQIKYSTDVSMLIDEINRVVSYAPERMRIYITLDCTSDIFEENEIVAPKYERVWEECKNYGYNVGQDHLIPFCYVMGTKIPIPHTGVKCSIDCAGLIDSSYNLRFCNQHNQKLIQLFTKDGIASYDILNKLLIKKLNSIENDAVVEKCENCPYWASVCTGGCFVGKR